MKQSKIQAIHVYVSDKKRSKNIPDQIANSHLRFAERRMNELGLSKNDKLIVLDGIIANLKSMTTS